MSEGVRVRECGCGGGESVGVGVGGESVCVGDLMEG